MSEGASEKKSVRGRRDLDNETVSGTFKKYSFVLCHTFIKQQLLLETIIKS